MKKELRTLLRELESQGFAVRRSHKGHLLIQQDGRIVASFASTPSDWRSFRNSIAQLRHVGFVGSINS
jgi:hypothetical protein